MKFRRILCGSPKFRKEQSDAGRGFYVEWRTGKWRAGKWRTGKWKTGKWRTQSEWIFFCLPFSCPPFSCPPFFGLVLVAKYAKALLGTIYILDAYCLVQVASALKSGVKPGVKTNHRRTV